MVIPFLIEANPARITKTARMLLRTGRWKMLASNNGKYSAVISGDSPVSIEFTKNSPEFELKEPTLVQIDIASVEGQSLTLLAEKL